MVEYDRKKTIYKWKAKFEKEFCILNKLLTNKLQQLDPKLHECARQELSDSFVDLIVQLENYLGVEVPIMEQTDGALLSIQAAKEKANVRELKEQIAKFATALNTIDRIVSQKLSADRPLKQALEQLKSIFCSIVSYLISAGFPAITVEGTHISSTDPSDYIKPLKPFSERTQISYFFLDRLQKELALEYPGISMETQTGLSSQP